VNIVWLNGQLITGPLPLDSADRGLLLGDGVFETLLVLNGTPIWLEEHLARFLDAANALNLEIQIETVRQAVAQAVHGRSGTLRISLTRGAQPRGLSTTGTSRSNLLLSMSARVPVPIFSPLRLLTSRIRRNAHSFTSRYKTLSYIDNIAAAREAAAQSVDDALMLNTDGRVACSTIGNLCILQGQTLLTPNFESEGALPGVTINKLQTDVAPALGLTFTRGTIEPEQLLSADAVFLTNSLRLVMPLVELDRTTLSHAGAATVAQISEVLCNSIKTLSGEDPRVDA
jgi:branched-chain amino acid aminotransferase